ncbi:molecular chaperone TorD family protein [Xanthobacteraceae bacterium Astr-EGSB]|uniref:TorD/DmsD family molecular chaperone n=1 Tax=Astrobacterium formosum TaxID=3069710 RepID=UPI0027B55EA8|nr:molecular chaperone TorD family protein [Xanthobacteraceae bacterium Astr-EGSB]
MDRDRILVALRGFFAARDGGAMVAAYAALAQADPTGEATRADAPAADDLECDFNRLFVGPGKVAAPPYASVYLDSDHRLMGDATRRAAAIYDAIGLSSPLPGSLPDDHLALELDAVLAFRALLVRGASAELAALWRYFLHDHLAVWVPRFAAAVRRAEPVSPAIVRVVALLSAWLDEETGETASVAGQQGGAACPR